MEQQAPWVPSIERFGSPAQSPTLSFELMSTPFLPRLWFVNAANNELLQVQSNWFARNWRKTDASDVYPRYPRLRKPFRDDLQAFIDFIRERDLGDLRPVQCEVTYVNHIDPEGIWAEHGEIARVVSLAARGRPASFLSHPETVRLAAQYQMIVQGEAPYGRLYVNVEPGFKQPELTPIFVLTLTARGRPLGEGMEGVMRFLDEGREWIVRGFASVTTPTMHRVWGRKDA